MMSEETACSFLKIFGLWCDLFNIIVGVGVLSRGIVTSGIGYLLVHIVSISYLVFHKKLGFKYHQSTTRILVLIPDLFLVIYTVLSSPSYRCSYESPSYHRSYVSPSYRCSYETQGLEIALVFLGFAWSFICAVSSLISFYCVCTPRSRAPENSNIEGKKLLKLRIYYIISN